MMKNLLILTMLAACSLAYAQEYHRCYTHESMQAHEEAYPGYLARVNETFERAKAHESFDRSTLYTVKVVFHVVYNTPEENLADSVILNQLDGLNADYRRLNADTLNLRDTFQTIVGDSYIQFELATIDPDGNPTTGITRTETDETSFLDFGGGGGIAEGVKSTAGGGINPWDQEHYLNIWICDMSLFGTPFVLGYATPPDGLPHWPAGSTAGMSDGVVLQYEFVGSNNPNVVDLGSGPLDVQGRTCTHEVGHYLGLRHIWGDGDCTQEDGVDDTPNADDQSNQDCDISKNTCTDAIGVLGDLPDMVENYMDYSAETCQNSFTLGQIDLMRGVLEVERIELINFNPVLGIPSQPQPQWTVYPNPSSGENITISGLSGEESKVEVYNEAGKLIKEFVTHDELLNFELESKGIFIVKVLEAGNTSVKLLIII